MIEFLFCPQHGLLRPDNLIYVASVLPALWSHAIIAINRFITLTKGLL